MYKFLEKLESAVKPISTVVLIFFVFIFFGATRCTVESRTTKAVRKEVARLEAKVDSLGQANKLLLELEGYKVSKRLVYDENTIVRSTKRPDDVMAEYDKKIEEINKKLAE